MTQRSRPLPWVVCFAGGNFCGKSTQAELFAAQLADEFGVETEVFDTRTYIEPRVYDVDANLDAAISLANDKETTLRYERTQLEAGEANTTEWVADCVVIPELIPALRAGRTVIFPGSPRVKYEGQRFAEELTPLWEEGALAGCLVIFVDTDKDVCYERAVSWFATLTDPVERKRKAYKVDDFDKRWEWFEQDTMQGAFRVLESAPALNVVRRTVRDDGTRDEQTIAAEVRHKAILTMFPENT